MISQYPLRINKWDLIEINSLCTTKENIQFNWGLKPANLENSAVSGHRTGKCVFIPIPKKDNAKECSNYCTIALISHASKVMLKIPKPGFSNT